MIYQSGDDIQQSYQQKGFYYINCNVILGLPALIKAVTTDMKKYCIFLCVFDIASQLLTHHLPFAPLGQVDK